MTIDEEIKSTFKSEQHRLTVNLIYTSNWMIGSQALMLKRHGLTVPQYNVLRILRGQHPKPIRVNDIIERMLDKMSNASRLVDKLVEKKLVVRKVCSTDRRAVDVVINKAGLELLKVIDPIQDEFMDNLGGNLNTEETKTLSELLDKMRSPQKAKPQKVPKKKLK